MLTAAPTGDGHVLLVQQHVAGETLDRLPPAQVDDRLLAAVWAEVARLHAARIAHRDLRRANVLVDLDRQPWLLDFGFAEAAASPRRLAADVAELLASLASVVGADRTVRSATEALGVDAVVQALPLLQPAALAAATRADLKAQPRLLDELRERTAATAGTEPPPLEPLTRVRPRTLLLLVAAGFAVHLLLPQVGELRQTLGALQAARWPWLAAGLVLSAASYLAAAVAQLGAVDPPLALGRTSLVQVASSFANRLTPASLGGIGMNVRYLQRAGMDRPAAVAAVAVNTAAGALVHVLGLLVAAVLIGRARLGTSPIPKGWPVLVALAAVLAGGGLVLWSPLGRRRLVVPALRAGRELAGVLRRPGKSAQLLGGSAGVTLSYALTLACCLAAFGTRPPPGRHRRRLPGRRGGRLGQPHPLAGWEPWKPRWSPGSPPSASRPGRRSPECWPSGCSPSGCPSCPAGSPTEPSASTGPSEPAAGRSRSNAARPVVAVRAIAAAEVTPVDRANCAAVSPPRACRPGQPGRTR